MNDVLFVEERREQVDNDLTLHYQNVHIRARLDETTTFHMATKYSRFGTLVLIAFPFLTHQIAVSILYHAPPLSPPL
jgi:hypothetical protein